jgi:hypothetical protein
MEHFTSCYGQGENLYRCTSGNPSLGNAVKCWVKEKPLYNGERIGNVNTAVFATWGHNTQVLMRDINRNEEADNTRLSGPTLTKWE